MGPWGTLYGTPLAEKGTMFPPPGNDLSLGLLMFRRGGRVDDNQEGQFRLLKHAQGLAER